MKAVMKPWPKLSADLPYPRELGTCQSCGLINLPGVQDENLSRWLEHDENDRKTPVVVVLCEPCAKKIIEPHPRLYDKLDKWYPMPGAMELCVGCRWQTDLRCTSPLPKFNGGPGLEVTFPKPDSAHVNFGGGRGRFIYIFKGPPTACDGKETL